jgi:hypothetical protein
VNFDQAVDRCLDQFDCTQAQAVRIVNEAYKRMLAESEWLEAEKSITTTVAGQSSYDLPDEVGDLRRVDVGGNPYDGTGTDRMRDLLAGRRDLLAFPPGVFAKRAKADGTAQIDLFPIPAASGVAITGFEALVPADLSYGGASVLKIPVQLHPLFWNGIQAMAYLEVDERPDMAEYHDNAFNAGIAQLIRLKNKRVGATSGRRLLVAGFDW